MSTREFWAGVGRRSTCGECGYGEGEKVSLQRSHHESRGYFTCPDCGARGVYLHRGHTQKDETRGALWTTGVPHTDKPVPGVPDDE